MLARRKTIYLEMHPETAQGSAGGSAPHPTQRDSTVAATAVVQSFSTDTAEKTGMAERTVRDRTQAGKTLSPKAVSIIAETPAANSQSDKARL